jgi:hypothetical protein
MDIFNQQSIYEEERRVDDIFIFPTEKGCYKFNTNGTFTDMITSAEYKLEPGQLGYNISDFMRQLEYYIEYYNYLEKAKYPPPGVPAAPHIYDFPGLTAWALKNDTKSVLISRKKLKSFIDTIDLSFPDGVYYFFTFLYFCHDVKAYLKTHDDFTQMYEDGEDLPTLFAEYLRCKTIFVEKYKNYITTEELFKKLPKLPSLSLSLSFKPKSRKKSLKKSLKKSPKKSLKTSPKKSLKTSRKKAPKKAAR